MQETGTLIVTLLGDERDWNSTIILSGDGATQTKQVPRDGVCRFTVDTPPRSLSQTPRTRQKPYSGVNLRIITAGYVTVNIMGVQVFSGETSRQDVSMTRLANANGMTERVIIIPEHKLYVQAALREPNASAVATSAGMNERRVFIPETITVHLGAPGQSAANVTVPFPYYVKNVASSEIYATWPENSLRANILSIISLALNRVYTEWYRSQGYDFDVTSSTAFDQYFVAERNTFESINVIVDEIYTNYLARAGYIEPLFAEYCDGATVSCPGLSQWGTVQLARQGYTALGICQYYFGQEIELREAPVQPSESSFPGVLRPGDDTRDVALLQYRLNRVAINFPSIPFITDAEGVYGPTTRASVLAFQRLFGLDQTGEVNRETWYRILYIYNAVKKLAELGSEGERVQGDIFSGKTLVIGDRGSEVLRMQYYLNHISDSLGGTIVPRDNINGIFDDSTRAAVRAFQNYIGLTPTGTINKATWDAIVNTYYMLPPAENGLKEYPGTPVRRGMSGEDVLYIQRLLNAISAYETSIPMVEEDGVFGPATENAVMAFQRYASLQPDGVVGQLTWNALNQTYGGLAQTTFSVG